MKSRLGGRPIQEGSDRQFDSGHVLEGCDRRQARRAIVHFLVIRVLRSTSGITIDSWVDMIKSSLFFFSFSLSLFLLLLPFFIYLTLMFGPLLAGLQ